MKKQNPIYAPRHQKCQVIKPRETDCIWCFYREACPRWQEDHPQKGGKPNDQ